MYRLLTIVCCINAFTATPLKNISQCRRRRISGGKAIEIEMAPYQVSIIRTIPEDLYGHVCGGSIISGSYVLTAAHCLKYGVNNLVVKSGTSFWAEGGHIHHIVKAIRHEKYDGKTYHGNDIAILKVNPKFDFDGKKVKIIELAETDAQVQDGDDAFASGWGITDWCNFLPSPTLQGVNTKILDFEKCKQLDRDGRDLPVDNICVKNPTVEKGTCEGDSGGALVVKGKQVGIVSWGVAPCAFDEFHVNVAMHREWIDKHTKDDRMDVDYPMNPGKNVLYYTEDYLLHEYGNIDPRLL